MNPVALSNRSDPVASKIVVRSFKSLVSDGDHRVHEQERHAGGGWQARDGVRVAARDAAAVSQNRDHLARKISTDPVSACPEFAKRFRRCTYGWRKTFRSKSTL